MSDSFVIFGYNVRDGVATDKNGLIYMRARYYSPDKSDNSEMIPKLTVDEFTDSDDLVKVMVKAKEETVEMLNDETVDHVAQKMIKMSG